MFKEVLSKSVVVMGLSLMMAVPSVVFAQTCKVTDPTGTPLNIRATPSGDVIGELKNGTLVVVSEYKNDIKGRPWALVFNAKTDRYIGWVYREFISCFDS